MPGSEVNGVNSSVHIIIREKPLYVAELEYAKLL